VVFASPHSGTCYSDTFLAQSALDPLTLRRSEDSFVDELFQAAPSFGAPLLRALFPRAYVDANREPFELDPAMFDGALPDYVNTDSPRVSAGLGTIARVVASGAEIYRRKLSFEEAKRRIDLLGIDTDANLVVIELKRTEDGGHMELQAIRYAAMISAMTFSKAVEVYGRYLERNNSTDDAETALLQFLNWDVANEDTFGRDVRIVLVSAEFSKEITTSVLWLNAHALDIRCVRLRPYARAHTGTRLCD